MNRNNLIKIISAFAIAMLMAAFSSVAVFAAANEYTVSLDPATLEVEEGREFSLQVNISSAAADHYNYAEVHIRFDDDLVSFEAGDQVSGSIATESAAGLIIISIIGENKPITGSCELAELRFKGINAGEASFVIEEAYVGNRQTAKDNIDAEISNEAKVNITAGTGGSESGEEGSSTETKQPSSENESTSGSGQAQATEETTREDGGDASDKAVTTDVSSETTINLGTDSAASETAITSGVNTAASETANSTDNQATPQKPSGGSIVVYIIIIAAVCVIAAIVIVIIVREKKNNKE